MSAAAACAADPQSMRQLCSHGPNASFSKRYCHPILHRKPLPSSTATSAPLRPPRPSRVAVRYVKAGAARAQNAPQRCLIYAPNSPRRQINFWPRLPVLPRGFLSYTTAMPPKSAIPYFDWKFHPENKWWTFQKGHGKTTTRFGRFEESKFVTGNPSTPAPSSGTAASAPAVVGTAACPITID